MPTRVLIPKIQSYFMELSPTIKEILKDEIEYNNLKNEILLHEDEEELSVFAEIDTSQQIHIYENYCSFLWAICYSLIVMFEEGLVLPTNNNEFDGTVGSDTKNLEEAFELLNYGLSLKKEFTNWNHNLPNPEIYNENNKCYIDKANSIYVAAKCFVIGHELGHQYFGHLTEEGKKDRGSEKYANDELIADSFALELLSKNALGNYINTHNVGCICALGSIVLVNSNFDQGENYPDSKSRMKKLIEEMNIEDEDNMIWGYAALIFCIWDSLYDMSSVNGKWSTLKELFYAVYNTVSDN